MPFELLKMQCYLWICEPNKIVTLHIGCKDSGVLDDFGTHLGFFSGYPLFLQVLQQHIHSYMIFWPTAWQKPGRGKTELDNDWKCSGLHLSVLKWRVCETESAPLCSSSSFPCCTCGWNKIEKPLIFLSWDIKNELDPWHWRGLKALPVLALVAASKSADFAAASSLWLLLVRRHRMLHKFCLLCHLCADWKADRRKVQGIDPCRRMLKWD